MGLLSIAQVPDPNALFGQRIELTGVPVQQRSSGGLWVGENHDDQVFVAVAPADGRKIPNVQAGARVDVSGIIRAMPEASAAIERWNLRRALAEELEDEVFYIEAQSVQATSARKARPGAAERS